MTSLARVTTMTDRIPDPPKPGTYYVQFQRELAASEHISTLANLLANIHWLFEGWILPAGPLGGDLKRVYQQAACYAVRACSDIEQKVATARAARWAQRHYLKLRLGTIQAASEEEVDRILADFVAAIIDEHRHHLMHGAHVISPRDRVEMADLDEEIPDDPRRI